MDRKISAFLALTLLLCVQPAASQVPLLRPDQPIPPAELEAFIDGFVASRMATNGIAGVTVSVVQNGEVRLTKGYGFADLASGRRVDPATTLFRVGSITKTFTYIALMRLVEAGKLSLDDPGNDHLPAELQVPDDGFDQPIRLRDLVTHQPGFEDRVLGVLFVETPDDIRPLTEFLRETMPERVRPPGEFSSYSNHGIGLLGAVIEHETGRLWQDVVEQDIMRPLGMLQSSTREPYPPRDDLPAPMPAQLAANASTGYRRAGGAHQIVGYEYITQVAPAGVVSATAADMARYMLMLLNDGELDGRRIFGAEAARVFRTPMTDLPREVGGWDGGFAEFPLPGGFRGYGHDGATLAFFSGMYVAPELDLGVFVSTNTAGGATLSSALWPALVGQFYAPQMPAPLAGQPDQRAAMAEYAGNYVPSRRESDGLAGFVMGMQIAPVRVTPDGYLTFPGPGGPRRFVPTSEPDRFRAADGAGFLVFVRRDGELELPTLAQTFERIGSLRQPGVLAFLAGLCLLTVIGTFIGVRVRAGRGLPCTPAQKQAGRLQIVTAVCWFLSLAAAAVFTLGAVSNQNALVFRWPTTSVLAFSTMALIAGITSGAALALVPSVWRGGDGWTRWRKLRYSAGILIFCAFALVLLVSGALQPWKP